MSSLGDFGDGILRTHVTWDDIQKDCLEVVGSEAVFGANKTVQSIGDGRGFMSKMAFIFPDWETPITDTAPKQFVVKICSQIANKECSDALKGAEDALDESIDQSNQLIEEKLQGTFRKMHNIEAEAYSLIEKYNVTIPVPKVYKTVLFSEENLNKGYIIMEYIENSKCLNVYDNMTVNEVKQILREIAKLQASSLLFSAEDKQSLVENPFKDLVEFNTDPVNQKGAVAILRQFGGIELKKQVDKFEETISEIVDFELAFGIGKDLGMEPVLVHGDAWSSNLLWMESEDELSLGAILDFQTAHFGIPAVDIFRVMVSCLSYEDLDQNWNSLIDFFYETLISFLQTTPAPYTLEQLKESIRRFSPMGCFFLIPMLAEVFDVNTHNMQEDNKNKVKAPLLRKMAFVMDQMFIDHERNMRRLREMSLNKEKC